MDFIYFANTIFRKKHFVSAQMEKNKVLVDIGENNALMRECESEEQAKGVMRELVDNLNKPNK